MASRTAAARKRAKATAKVQFGGQRSDLQALLGEAATNLQSDLVAADAASRSGQHFARAAKPEIKKVYNAAAGRLAGAREDVANAFATAGPASSVFKAATAREQGGATMRLETARADALTALDDRIQAAAAGKGYAQQAATQKYRQTVSDLQSKLSDLKDREGASVVATMGDILEKGANRRATRSNIRLTAGLSAAEHRRQEAAKAKADKDKAAGGGGKPASRAELRDFQGTYAKALRTAQGLKTAKKDGKPLNLSRAQMADLLVKGVRGDQTTKTPDIPSIGDQLALSAALDMVYDGHVSRGNARALHKERGIKVAQVRGATSFSDWRKRGMVGRNQAGGTPERPAPHGGMY